MGAGIASTIQEESEVRGASLWLLLMRDELRALSGDPLLRSQFADMTYEVWHTGGSLWILITWPSGARLACCAAYAPTDTSNLNVQSLDGTSLNARLSTAIGDFCVQIELPGRERRVLHWQTTLLPATELTMPFWPRDILPIDPAGDPLSTRGTIHATQYGPKGGLLYCSLLRPAAGSFLYMQNLTALNDYFEQTQTAPDDRVGGQWPELGFALPTTSVHALAAGKETVISDAYILASPDVPEDDVASARLFLDLYAELYLAYPRPVPVHREWPRRVNTTIYDLTHGPKCTVEIDGHDYLLAYVGADDRPPESMVQLAVLVPLVEYARSRDEDIPLIDKLKANLPTFFDPRAGTIVRWLPGQEHLLEGKEEHMRANIMDSWYLWHTYLNLSRLALQGDQEARQLLLDSIDYGIRVAQHFEYRWPVFYDLYTLEVIKAETAPGCGGEHDVAAQYAHVMMQVWELTKEQRFVDEAARAARNLRGLGFALGYQFNNTSFGAGGLLRLWQETGEDLFRGLSYVCLANIVRNIWLWECDYGYAKYYSTFMGLTPLQDAVYLALYEELEVLAAFHEYLRLAGDDVLPALRVLLPEYCKYLTDHAWYHYPSELPEDILPETPQSGHLNHNLSVPLEDIRDGWNKPGQVGQQVYGTAAPFVFATRHCHAIPGEEFLVHCNYPTAGFDVKRSKGKRVVRFKARGDQRCTCQVRIVPSNVLPLPPISLAVRTKRAWTTHEGQLTELGYLTYDLPGDAEVKLEWTKPTPQSGRKQAKPRSQS